MVGLKLFTSIDRFEIMAIPFFILAGNFLTSGGVARRMIDFATSHDRALVWRARPRRRRRLRAVRRHLGLLGRDRGRHRLHHSAGDRGERLSAAVRRRRDRDLRGARHPVSALDQSRHLRGRDQRHAAASGPDGAHRRVRLGRPAVHRRRRTRAHARHHARHHHLVSRLAQRLSAHAAGELGRVPARLPRELLGPVPDRAGAGRHLFRAVHPDRGRRRGGGLRVLHRGVRLQGTQARDVPARAAQGRRP